ncbi:GGDEF and EAL domain-containing protein [Clostridium sp. 001]|uniref:bifunctional diguanylate cyclase/phosphodiesterase n=1 Tax=Clostridium sp. 001 TaxID=1970093 RepID=UPI001C2C2308|nr:GGDEF and EAL domain-containing protein [Clostridium sp. 001]QXE20710.1 GGDEF-domain containing protein [Clostridium sp. 001]
MCRNDKYNLENDNVYTYALNMGNLGVCKWNIDTGEMVVSEKITGYEFNSIKSMNEFINIITYEKDKMMAIQDLDDYINGSLEFYRSTFRIKTKCGEIKWVLLKGKIFKDETESSGVLGVLIFNITNMKFYDRWDSLTKLPNREFFLIKLNNSIKMAEIHNKKGALIYIDIDNLKIINHNFGHHLGDWILKSFAKSITVLLGKQGELFRLEGDEFAILIYEFNDIKKIEKMCNKIHKCLKKSFRIMGKEIYISTSLGVTVFPDDSSDPDELLKFCNFAVYKSKGKGKNECTFFDKQKAQPYFRKILIDSELKNSIINNELDIFYQPQINALNNKIIGFEALLRWNNNKLGNVPPAEFIPVAEDNGYIVQIGNWVLNKALDTACAWKEKGYKFRTISVNVSPIQLEKSDFKMNILNICAKHNVEPSLLEIEITERTLIEIGEDRIELLNELMESGVSIAIDDFGTGYSSLSYLINLAVNTLKIDKSFISNIHNDKNKAVIGSIVKLSKYLKYKVITEGVETREQLDEIIGLGCNLIQGYYFSKPLKENKMEDLLKNQSK